MARGIERRDIYEEDRDREDMVERLGLISLATGSAIYAWSLLPNHFHLLLRSGESGLTCFMRRLQTGYAVAFNRRHRRCGHLFQNRFKSILVQEERYLLELVRYIHLNPLRAGVVRELRALDGYRWSGHAVLIGKRDAGFQDTNFVLSQFGRGRELARREYRAFIKEGVVQGRRHELSGGGLLRSVGGREKVEAIGRGRERWASDERVLGSSEFVVEVQEHEHQAHASMLARRVMSPVEQLEFVEKLLAQVARTWEVAAAELGAGSRRRTVVEARAVLFWLGKAHVGLSTRVLAEAAGVSPVSVRRLLDTGRGLLARRGLKAEDLIRKCTK